MARSYVNVSGEGGGIDTRDFHKFAAALRRGSPVAAKELRLNLRGAGEIVAKKVRDKAPGSIKGSVKVRAAGASVTVTAGNNGKWWAIPIENKGRGNVSHPTFGHDPITNKNSHPAFFHPAVEESRPELEAAALDALVTAIESVVAETEI